VDYQSKASNVSIRPDFINPACANMAGQCLQFPVHGLENADYYQL
jgi:hypothetical protein